MPDLEPFLWLVEGGGRSSRLLVEECARRLGERGLAELAIGALAGEADPAKRWVRAALLEQAGRWAEAEAELARVTSLDGLQIPDVLLERARIEQRSGTPAVALAHLRAALAMHPDYPFYIRAERLASKCADPSAARRRVRIALVGTSTTSFLASVLKLLCLRDRIEAELYEAPLGALEQTILGDDLYAFQPDFVLLLVNWRDAALPDLAPDPSAVAARMAATYERLWERLAVRSRARILQTTFGLPPADPCQALAAASPAGRVSVLREINRRLRGSAGDRVDLLDSESLAGRHPGTWDDPVEWSAARMYPSGGALPVLAEEIVSYMRAHLGLGRKVLAVDLDNTLWGGVVGEDGLAGIQLGPPSALGERYQDLQRYLLSLKQRGVLLAVVSKNNPEDAAAVFRRHPGAVLTLGDFAAFAANWNDKPENLRQIASSLDLALDSFVFLDDNPVERERVRTALPDVAVPEIPGEPARSIGALERGRYFQALHISEEDRKRTESYGARRRGRELAAACGSVTDYLDSLDMTIREEPVDLENCSRVAQLINKTNQCNLTTRRYTVEQVRALLDADGWWFRAFRLADRFTDHGLIAVMLVAQEEAAWRVDSWLLSCRVIGRGVEKFMFNTLLEAARRAGAASLGAEYLPTSKNAPVSTLLPSLGFERDAAGAWRLDVGRARLAECPYFRPPRPPGETEPEGAPAAA